MEGPNHHGQCALEATLILLVLSAVIWVLKDNVQLEGRTRQMMPHAQLSRAAK